MKVEQHEQVEAEDTQHSGMNSVFPDGVSEQNGYDWDDGTSRRSDFKDNTSSV